MSQIFVCVIKREKHTIPPAFLEQIAQLASRSDMYVFCPPKYIEEFMRTPKYGNLLVFDLADNDEYDDCEEFYYTVDCDLQNKRIETMVHIANYVLSCGYPLEFFMTVMIMLAPPRSFPSLRSVLRASAYPWCSTLSLCRKPSFPRFSAFITLTSFRSLLETYDCSALPLKKKLSRYYGFG